MRIASLHVYPIKSCAGLALDRAEVAAHGLRHDRRWMLIDAEGRFVTGRQEGRMVAIHAEPDAKGLRLLAPDMPPLFVPVPAVDAPRTLATVWKDAVDAACAGGEADAWFSAYLGRPLRLVYFDARSRRAVDPAYAHSGDEVAFADGYPLLAVSQSAVDALNARIHERSARSMSASIPASSISMMCFRPNLVIAGAAPHAEDMWRCVRIGDIVFDAVKPCTRCVFTTVDSNTGERDPGNEPLATLKDYRRTAAGITFGMNLIPRGAGMLSVGDAIEVLA